MKRIINFALIALLLGAGISFLPQRTNAEGGFGTSDILTYFHLYNQSNHASSALANEINDGAIKNPDDAACLKCHSSHGFIQWAGAGFDPKFKDFKTAKKGNAQGANCLTCHDPLKKPAGPGDNMLRLAGATPMLDAGYKVNDAGKGAVCMICHNSRRGLYNDQARPRMNPGAPHETSNTDLLMGQNFYFIEVGEPSGHAHVSDTCSGCHMRPVDKAGRISSHSLKSTWESCTQCHDKMDSASLKKEIMTGVDKMKNAYDRAVAKMVQTALNAGKFRLQGMAEDETEDKEWTEFRKGRLTEIKGRYFHGRQAFDLKIDGKKYLAFIHKMSFQGSALVDTSEGQKIAKAGWNFYMLDHDRSHGAHGPGLYRKVIDATIKQLQSVDFSKVTPLPKEEKK